MWPGSTFLQSQVPATAKQIRNTLTCLVQKLLSVGLLLIVSYHEEPVNSFALVSSEGSILEQ